MDLAEANTTYNSNVGGKKPEYPESNDANDLYAFVTGLDRRAISMYNSNQGSGKRTDYEKITSARKLAPTEYTVHPQLGYITLTRKLQNDEALAVAYEYSYMAEVL
jgi:cell surface protein SprA